LEALIFFLIACMTGSFFVNWGKAHADPVELFKGWIIPTLPGYALTQAVGTIGAVIMPHNLYLHSGLVLSRNIDRNSPKKIHDATWYNFLESALALAVSFVINLAIVATNAGEFFNEGCAETDGGPYACFRPEALNGAPSTGMTCALPTGGSGVCNEIGLKSEGNALKYGLGGASLYIWAFGLLAAGQAATMTATYAGQVIMGGCLEVQLAPWKRVAFTRIFALGPSVLVAVLTYGNEQLFNNINEYLNVLQSVQLPFAMLPLIYFTSQVAFMGRFRSNAIVLGCIYSLAGLVLAVNAVLIVQFVEGYSVGGIIAVCCYAALYLFLCGRMLFPSLS